MEVGWAGSAPHFIYTHYTSSQHQRLFCFDFVFTVRDDLARLLILLLLALVRMCSSQQLPCGSLDLPFATRLVVFHLEREHFNAKPEWSGSRQNIDSGIDPVNVVLVEPICEDFWYSWDHWHRHRGRRRRGAVPSRVS